jgi:hypothetical protein
MQLKQAHQLIGIESQPAPDSLLAMLRKTFPKWKYTMDFALSVPSFRQEIIIGSSHGGYLDDAASIECDLENAPATAFVPVGVLASGGMTAIDTRGNTPMEFGVFPFEASCVSNWGQLKESDFVSMGIPYNDWLTKLHECSFYELCQLGLV